MIRFTSSGITRRGFSAFLSCSPGSVWARAATAAQSPPPGADNQVDAAKGSKIDNKLPPAVQMQFMRPGQVEAAARRFPVVYVPLGTIEWHGRHLPLGCDALKSHGILVKCAEKYGGVVHPPIYFHDRLSREHLEPLLTRLFDRLKRMGFRVIIGVSGHNVRGQIDMLEAALKPLTADRSMAGIGIWEVSLADQGVRGKEVGTDHAASWETSDMQFLYPDTVDLGALGAGPLKLDMSPPDGINGLDPRLHASARKGARNIELCADAIGLRARQLLDSLAADQRGFGLKSVSPENWWML